MIPIKKTEVQFHEPQIRTVKTREKFRTKAEAEAFIRSILDGGIPISCNNKEIGRVYYGLIVGLGFCFVWYLLIQSEAKELIRKRDEHMRILKTDKAPDPRKIAEVDEKIRLSGMYPEWRCKTCGAYLHGNAKCSYCGHLNALPDSREVHNERPE